MLSAKDITIVYETLLTSPGMNDTVKIDLRIPRRNVLFLTKVIELGVAVKDDGSNSSLFSNVTGETLEEIKDVSTQLLTKAGLGEMYYKLNSLSGK